MKAIIETILLSPSKEKVNCVVFCINMVLAITILSTLPLWIVLFEISVALLLLAIAAEFTLRILCFSKKRTTTKNIHSNACLYLGTTRAERLPNNCCDFQGRLNKTHLPKEQSKKMSKTILREAKTHNNFFRSKNKMFKFWALRKIILKLFN